MQHLEIEPTYRSPHVIFNPEEGLFKIEGNSILVNVEEFYNPLLEWMDEFVKQKSDGKIEIVFDIEHTNLASAKRLVFFLYRIKELVDKGVEVEVCWRYNSNDNDAFELGQDFAQVLELPINFLRYEKLKKREIWAH